MKEDLVKRERLFNAAVIVAALGYFVDVYDLILFGVVKKSSLLAIGVAESSITPTGQNLLHIQMAGMLIGGILWGVLGDKKGRLKVLFFSIFLYSIANILNAFVVNVPQYGVLRFIAGLGLAGELGAGITLVTESLDKKRRGWGTMLVASICVMGAVSATLIYNGFVAWEGSHSIAAPWQSCYLVGGILGIGLLFLRVSVKESKIYNDAKDSTVEKGNFFMLFTNWKRFLKYLQSIVIGMPIWFVIGSVVFNATDFALEIGVVGKVEVKEAIMFLLPWFNPRRYQQRGVKSAFRFTKKSGIVFYSTHLHCALLNTKFKRHFSYPILYSHLHYGARNRLLGCIYHHGRRTVWH